MCRLISAFAVLSFFIMAIPAHAATAVGDAAIVHMLNRLSFGPTPQDIATVRRIGIEAYIEQQLHPQSLPMPAGLQQRLESLPITGASLPDLVRRLQPNREGGKLSPEERKEQNARLREIVFELAESKILRAIASPAQLQEVMTDFWYNHFNVFWGKGLDRVFTATYERDAIRPYALGKFRDLLEATAHHPAMLVYLDNRQNTGPDSVKAKRVLKRKGKELGINENYAREIMELHTLGVNGGYTQQDVTNLAHILTGWGIGRGKEWSDKAVFYFDPNRHDFSDQKFLGRTIEGGGMESVETVLDMLATSPATAHHIAYKLAQCFVADDPPKALVNQLAQTYLRSGGDIADMLRVLFHSQAFWDTKYYRVKFKPPFRYVVSAFRALDIVPSGDMRKLQGAIAGMGEPLYRCLTPNGYAITNELWLNSDALLKRISVAKRLSRFFNEGSEAEVRVALGQSWSMNTLNVEKNVPPRMRPALLLSSPEFLYY